MNGNGVIVLPCAFVVPTVSVALDTPSTSILPDAGSTLRCNREQMSLGVMQSVSGLQNSVLYATDLDD